ncbi:MAG TPA: hypothetical protein EYP76_04870, partial [Thiomicrorhabdus sp.]|nr:hypothetical protein [Thiomicrorhabdus sp.]
MRFLSRFQTNMIICIVVFLVGILITELRYTYLYQQEIKTLKNHFNEYSLQSYLALSRGLEQEVDRLKKLVMVFEVEEHVSREEFNQYAQVIVSSGISVQSVQWTPVVKEADRVPFEKSIRAEGFENFTIQSVQNGKLVPVKKSNQYAVVNYIYPFEVNQMAMGLDVYSSQNQRAGLLQAASTGSVVASAPIQLVQAPRLMPSVILYHPIYNAEGMLMGYVNLILNVDFFWKTILRSMGIGRSLHYQITDQNVQNTPYLTLQDVHLDKGGENFLLNEFLIPIGGRFWQFQVMADLTQLPHYKNNRDEGGFFYFIFGWALSALLAVFVFIWLKLRQEKQTVQDKLKAQEQRYRALFEQSSNAFYLLDYEGN